MSDRTSAHTFALLFGHLAEGGTIDTEFLWNLMWSRELNLDFNADNMGNHDDLVKLGLRIPCPDCGLDDDEPAGYLEGLPGARECYEGHKEEPIWASPGGEADFIPLIPIKARPNDREIAAALRSKQRLLDGLEDPDDMEILAAAEHESWSGWTTYMLEQIQKQLREEGAGIGVLSKFGKLSCIQRWQRQLATPYASLSEKEKESDRVEARKKLGLYRGVSTEGKLARELHALYADAVLCEDAREFVMVMIERAIHAGLSKDGDKLTMKGMRALEAFNSVTGD